MSLSTRIRSSSPPGHGGTTAKTLTHDHLLEIISRVPARERWRCKCVSKLWLRLARTLPQSLAGFFYTSTNEERFPETALHFFNVSGRPQFYPSFNFLPNHRRIDLLDWCSGLFLCRWYGAYPQVRNVVCNPATNQWVALPDNPGHSPISQEGPERLGFNPAVSPHFHVFSLLLDGCYISGVDVYSSETGRWVHKDKEWDEDVFVTTPRRPIVFLNGYLHFQTCLVGLDDSLVPYLTAVATDGETWTNFHLPSEVSGDEDVFIQLSQGRLHYANFTADEYGELLVVYVLEDYDNKEWELEHRVQTSRMFRGMAVHDLDADFDWITIHPDCNVIFFTEGSDKTFMWYNMDLQQARVIRTLRDGQSPYLPYVPLYTELQSLRM